MTDSPQRTLCDCELDTRDCTEPTHVAANLGATSSKLGATKQDTTPGWLFAPGNVHLLPDHPPTPHQFGVPEPDSTERGLRWGEGLSSYTGFGVGVPVADKDAQDVGEMLIPFDDARILSAMLADAVDEDKEHDVTDTDDTTPGDAPADVEESWERVTEQVQATFAAFQQIAVAVTPLIQEIAKQFMAVLKDFTEMVEQSRVPDRPGWQSTHGPAQRKRHKP